MNITEQEYILRNYGLSKDDVDNLWDKDCKEVGRIRWLSGKGLAWTDLEKEVVSEWLLYR